MGPLGVPEMIFIFVAALVIFGPKKLPELGKHLGKGMAEFRRASSELKSTFQREMDNIERETSMQDVREAASSIKSDIQEDFSAKALMQGEDDYYDEYGSDASSPSTHSSATAASSAAAAPSDTAAEPPPVAATADNSSAPQGEAEKGAA